MISKERLTELADKNTICKVSHEERVALATELLELRQQIESENPKQDDGWIEWGGGDMPPIMDEIVEAKFRGGATDVNLCRNFYWGLDEKHPHNDIIAYRIVS